MSRWKAVLFAAVLLLLPSLLAAQVRDIAVERGGAAVRLGGETAFANSWALVVGVNRYRHSAAGIPNLSYAVNDARSVGASLVKLGFPAGQVITLLDEEATRRAIEEALYERMRPSSDDRLFVFFAGHGTTQRLPRGGEEGYILPYDAHPRRLATTAISMTEVKNWGRRIAAKHIFVAVDACYSGFAITRSVAPPIIDMNYLRAVTKEPAVQVLTAGRAKEQVQEREGHGLFTKLFLQGLEGFADGDRNGVLTALELASWVESRVIRDSDGQQNPQFSQLAGEGQFVFVLPGAAPPVARVEPLAPPAGPPAESPEAARLREEAAKLRREREQLEAEKRRLEEQTRLQAERQKIEEERQKLAAERERLARLQREREEARRKELERRRLAFGPPEAPPGPPMVEVPAGWFVMGDNHGDGDADEKPSRRVYLDAFFMDKYPVTNEWYGRFMAATGRRAPPIWIDSPDFGAPNQPVNVTWHDADAFCKWLGRRLPTEAEWEKAARGPDGWKYPWGNEWDPDKAIWSQNSGGKPHPVDRTYHTHASPYGLVDMSGNVWQWVADWYDKDYYARAPERNPKGPESGQYRVLRGGSWYFNQSSLRAASRSGCSRGSGTAASGSGARRLLNYPWHLIPFTLGGCSIAISGFFPWRVSGGRSMVGAYCDTPLLVILSGKPALGAGSAKNL